MSLTAGILRPASGRLLFAQRRFGETLGDFRAAGEIATGGLAISPCWLPWRSEAALAALVIGEPDTARGLSDEELEVARAFGAPRALGVALRAAGLVAGGARGEALLRQVIEVFAGPDTRLEQARALADLGALLRRRNQRVEARHPLRQAVDAAHPPRRRCAGQTGRTAGRANSLVRAVNGILGTHTSPNSHSVSGRIRRAP